MAISETTVGGFPALRAGGRGPALLFLHGAFMTHAVWRPWMERLAARGWPVVAASLRGRLGVGPERASGVKFADYLEDATRVVDALEEAPILIGHSLGGLLAQKLAEAGRARAMVLVAPAPPGMLTAQAVALPAYLPMMPRILTGAPVMPACSACERIALNCTPVEERQRVHDSSGAVYREMIFGSVKVDAAKVTCPTWVIGGAEDRIVSAALMRSTAARYKAELKLYDGHAHYILGEPGWESVVDDVAAWLEERRAVLRSAA